MKITYYKNLYTSPNLRHLRGLKWRLSHNAGNLALWVITPCGGKQSEPGANQLEFFHCMMLHQPWYKKRDLFVVGLAEGRAEAIELIARITRDCIAATGGTDLKAFLFPEEQGGRAPQKPRPLPTVRIVDAGKESP
ncbi:MAG: hypothetical protein LKE85_10025 [Lachnospiraceae bacterium]|jgi:hypothetical protein|nr:hypothetical protein [Lachnospiraceae bacterium]MDD5848919.1 hypothetical protein [Bacillota bacterium]